MLRLIEVFSQRNRLWLTLGSLAFLFVTIRMFHFYWTLLLFYGACIVIGFLQLLLDKDKRSLPVIIITTILALVYVLLVYR